MVIIDKGFSFLVGGARLLVSVVSGNLPLISQAAQPNLRTTALALLNHKKTKQLSPYFYISTWKINHCTYLINRDKLKFAFLGGGLNTH